jgi:hypothetical protein
MLMAMRRASSFVSICQSRDGGSQVTIVMGDGALLHHVIQAIGAAWRGPVTRQACLGTSRAQIIAGPPR